MKEITGDLVTLIGAAVVEPMITRTVTDEDEARRLGVRVGDTVRVRQAKTYVPPGLHAWRL